MVELFEKGYGKDAASIAHDAISQAKDSRTDVVLVDTAGRMQDNEPLMKALAKVNFSLWHTSNNMHMFVCKSFNRKNLIDSYANLV